MKIQIIMPALILFFSFSASVHSGSAISFSDANQRLSYSLGNIIGNTLKRKNLSLDETVLIKGIQDGQAQITPLLDSASLNQHSAEIRNQLQQKMGLETQHPIQSRREIYANRKLTGKAFMQANRHRQDVVSLPSGLQYKVVRPGDGVNPQEYDKVGIEFHIHTLEGKQIANSGARGETSVMPVNSLIKGLAEAVQLMRPGAIWEVYLPPQLAYGHMRRYANLTMVADIRLESVH